MKIITKSKVLLKDEKPYGFLVFIQVESIIQIGAVAVNPHSESALPKRVAFSIARKRASSIAENGADSFQAVIDLKKEKVYKDLDDVISRTDLVYGFFKKQKKKNVELIVT